MRRIDVIKKCVILSLLFVCLVSGVAQAFLFQIKTLDKTAITQLKDDKLVDTYIDVMIELEAVDKFFTNSGMKEKEYKEYERLLRYRTDLMLEIQKRKLDIPKIQ